MSGDTSSQLLIRNGLWDKARNNEILASARNSLGMTPHSGKVACFSRFQQLIQHVVGASSRVELCDIVMNSFKIAFRPFGEQHLLAHQRPVCLARNRATTSSWRRGQSNTP